MYVKIRRAEASQYSHVPSIVALHQNSFSIRGLDGRRARAASRQFIGRVRGKLARRVRLHRIVHRRRHFWPRIARRTFLRRLGGIPGRRRRWNLLRLTGNLRALRHIEIRCHIAAFRFPAILISKNRSVIVRRSSRGNERRKTMFRCERRGYGRFPDIDSEAASHGDSNSRS